VLEVVEQQQRRPAIPQPADYRIQRRGGGIALGTDRGGQGGHHVIGRGRAGQPHEPHSAGVLVEQFRCGHQRQARLADAASAGQTHQPLALDRERFTDLFEVILAPDERRASGGKVGRA
jgi:hypothetical protein